MNISMNVAEVVKNDNDKLQLLNKFNISTHRSFRLRYGRLNQDLMSMCRLAAMTTYDLQDRRNDLRFWEEGISLENEWSAQSVYLALLEKYLTLYPTTLEEDEILLATEPDNQRLVAATRYRHCKKRILHNHMNIFQRMNPMMDMLVTQELSNLKPNDPRGLQVNYMSKYFSTLFQMSSRGPKDKEGRVSDEDVRRQKEEQASVMEEEERQRLMLEEQYEEDTMSSDLSGEEGGEGSSSGNGSGSRRGSGSGSGSGMHSSRSDGVEHKSRSGGGRHASNVVVTHPYGDHGSDGDELRRLRTQLDRALGKNMDKEPVLLKGRAVQSGSHRPSDPDDR